MQPSTVVVGCGLWARVTLLDTVRARAECVDRALNRVVSVGGVAGGGFRAEEGTWDRIAA